MRNIFGKLKNAIELLCYLPLDFLSLKTLKTLQKKTGFWAAAPVDSRIDLEHDKKIAPQSPSLKLAQDAISNLVVSTGKKELILARAKAARIHQFDLLGSGPVFVAADEKRGQAVRAEMARLFGGEEGNEERIPLDYRPIDWHLDFKSGYRWDGQTPYHKIEINPGLGADIKMPWELSRFQHGPLLGLASLIEDREAKWAEEFVLQVTDWIAANPYPFGVNWSCAMDVAIRVVNWLWSWVLFKGHPALNDQFKRVITKSLHQHGLHIEKNLEYIKRGYHGNHYLANLAGLIYIGALLPGFTESDRWLLFGLQELIEEMNCQVYEDGVSFEGSTAYHRLAAEIFYSCTTLAFRLPDERREGLKRYQAEKFRQPRPGLPLKVYREQEFNLDKNEIFPRWYYVRLEKMADFILDITKSSGRVPQFGDNDSGRMHKFTPLLDAKGEEDFNDHRHILALAGKLFGRGDFKAAGEAYSLDAELLLGQVPFLPLGGGGRVHHYSPEPVLLSARTAEPLVDGSRSADHHNREERALAAVGATRLLKGPAAELTFTLRVGLATGTGSRVEAEPEVGLEVGSSLETGRVAGGEPAMPRVYYYPDGGIAIYKNQLYYFAFSCIPCGLGGVGAHNHNDLLSFELNLLGEDFIVDGGSYLYSADPEVRNAFRSTRAHNILVVRGREQRPITGSFLFALPEKARPKIVEVGKNHLIASHSGYGFKHHRKVSFTEEKIIMRDYLEKSCPAEQVLNLAPGVQIEAREEGSILLKNGPVNLEISGTGVKQMIVEEGFYSPSYGKRLANKRLVIPV